MSGYLLNVFLSLGDDYWGQYSRRRSYNPAPVTHDTPGPPQRIYSYYPLHNTPGCLCVDTHGE